MKRVLVYGMTDNPGGIETYLLNFFQRVQGKGVLLDFVSDFPAISGSDILERQGASLHFIPAKSKSLWGHLKGMWKILRQHKEYETVYFNILDAGAAVTMLVPFLLGRKIVVHSHNGSTDRIRLHKLCRPFLKIMTKGRVACSSLAAEYMFGDSKACLVIPNAIDGAKYAFHASVLQAKRQELGIENRPVICHVGRISRQKNPMGLIDIFEEVHRQRPETVLLSVGNGEWMEQFTDYIAKKNLADSVKCLGVRKDVAEILQASDVFLFPSLYEGLPISLLEAQAAGLSCVISDVISQQSIITDLVCPVSLNEPPQVWAERVLERMDLPRKNTLPDLIAAGYDISCCEEFDKQLIALF